MLVQFTVKNFLSFKDPATLSMSASKRRSKNKELDVNATFESGSGIRLLKCATVYGANASGKSNLISAVRFMKRFVIESSKESLADDKILVKPHRLSVETEGKPSRFEVVFIRSGVLYQYEFSADQSSIHDERLTRRSPKTKADQVLFSRVGNEFTIHKAFPEGVGLQKKTRKNALFLSVCANFDGQISTEVVRWFRNLRIISGLSDSGYLDFTINQLEDSGAGKKIGDLLKDFDLNIERFESNTTKQSLAIDGDVPEELRPLADALKNMKETTVKKVSTYHRRFDSKGVDAGEVAFDLKTNESEGTQKLVAMSGPLIDTLENSYVLLIDEFDARLHPIISKNIIKLFNCSEANDKNAQLIVATHDTNLLDHDLLRRDQVWFVERDYFGASHITSLVEYKGVRNDASFEKDYIVGKYGAIPVLGNIKRIFGPGKVVSNKCSPDE